MRQHTFWAVFGALTLLVIGGLSLVVAKNKAPSVILLICSLFALFTAIRNKTK